MHEIVHFRALSALINDDKISVGKIGVCKYYRLHHFVNTTTPFSRVQWVFIRQSRDIMHEAFLFVSDPYSYCRVCENKNIGEFNTAPVTHLISSQPAPYKTKSSKYKSTSKTTEIQSWALYIYTMWTYCEKRYIDRQVSTRSLQATHCPFLVGLRACEPWQHTIPLFDDFHQAVTNCLRQLVGVRWLRIDTRE